MLRITNKIWKKVKYEIIFNYLKMYLTNLNNGFIIRLNKTTTFVDDKREGFYDNLKFNVHSN